MVGRWYQSCISSHQSRSALGCRHGIMDDRGPHQAAACRGVTCPNIVSTSPPRIGIDSSGKIIFSSEGDGFQSSSNYQLVGSSDAGAAPRLLQHNRDYRDYINLGCSAFFFFFVGA